MQISTSKPKKISILCTFKDSQGINSTIHNQRRDQFHHSDLLFRAVKRSIPPVWPALQGNEEINSTILTCSSGQWRDQFHSSDLLFRVSCEIGSIVPTCSFAVGNINYTVMTDPCSSVSEESVPQSWPLLFRAVKKSIPESWPCSSGHWRNQFHSADPWTFRSKTKSIPNCDPCSSGQERNQYTVLTLALQVSKEINSSVLILALQESK